ncbi:hypothetical protein DFQ27_004097 [Actinomortierella ambigua]|uniref:Uncharacterized protein n=1 Tax=Actinomortierella ambigua TaxID=1343610 RepID=A0A9P6Q2S6_9FUNG|nr:hypothetical protein DFQ27_004097 [Actinomortierella ambigua]
MVINNQFNSLINPAMLGLTPMSASSSSLLSDVFTVAQASSLPSPSSSSLPPLQACKQCLVSTVVRLPACRGVAPPPSNPSEDLSDDIADLTLSGGDTDLTLEQKRCACFLGHHDDWTEPCSNICPEEVLFFLEGRLAATRNVNCAAVGSETVAGGGASGAQGSQDSSSSSSPSSSSSSSSFSTMTPMTQPPDEVSPEDQPTVAMPYFPSSSATSLSHGRDRTPKYSKVVLGLALVVLGLQAILV